MLGTQGMASKRKTRLVTAREPNGRIQREKEVPTSEARRLRDAALRGMRDAEWGTELGRLYLEEAITGEMYTAGKRWATDAAKYQASIGVFPVRAISLEQGIKSAAPDPDSEEGRKQVSREAEGAERFFEAHHALVTAGMLAESTVRRLCEDNLSLIGFAELQAARRGLNALAVHYGLTDRRKSANVR